jgi:hypothetical protein
MNETHIPEHWARVYWANRLDRRGLRLDTFLQQPAQILWSHLDFDTLRRDPLAGYQFLTELEHGDGPRPEFLPLLPRQIVVMKSLDRLEPRDDRRGIVRHAGVGFMRRPRPRSLAPEHR